jgi:hypothetical protein
MNSTSEDFDSRDLILREADGSGSLAHVYVQRTCSNPADPAYRLAELRFVNCALVMTIAGIPARELRNLAEFLTEYADQVLDPDSDKEFYDEEFDIQ